MAEARARPAWDAPTTNDHACRWYLALDGETEGPFRYEELLRLVREGRFPGRSHLWRPGFEQWIALSARPDFAAAIGERPTLGLVPATLEEADARATEDIRLSRDLVAEASVDGGALPPAPPPRAPSDAALRLTEQLAAWADGADETRHGAELPPAPAAGPDRSGRAFGPESVIELEAAWMAADRAAGYTTPGPRRWPLYLVLATALVGFGIAGWAVSHARSPDPMPSVEARRPAEARSTLSLAPARARPAAAEPVVAAVAEPTADPAPNREAALTWLNRAPDAEAPDETEPGPSSRPPARFRVAEAAARPPEPRLRAPSVVPAQLSDELVGASVSAEMDRFARCPAHDRLARGLPPGARLQLAVDGDGQVVRASLSGARGPIGRCLLRVARTMSFPRTQAASTEIELAFGRGGTVRARVL